MATLSQFTRAPIPAAGTWRKVGDKFEDLEICIVGKPDDYTDRRDVLMKVAAKAKRNAVLADDLPQIDKDRCAAKAFVEKRFGGIRGLFHDEKKTRPVTDEDLKAILLDINPDNRELLIVCLMVMNDVDGTRVADLKDDEGNSVPPSGDTLTE